jgi:hypothetical protein
MIQSLRPKPMTRGFFVKLPQFGRQLCSYSH